MRLTDSTAVATSISHFTMFPASKACLVQRCDAAQAYTPASIMSLIACAPFRTHQPVVGLPLAVARRHVPSESTDLLMFTMADRKLGLR